MLRENREGDGREREGRNGPWRYVAGVWSLPLALNTAVASTYDGPAEASAESDKNDEEDDGKEEREEVAKVAEGVSRGESA